jgi:hypothetical protein
MLEDSLAGLALLRTPAICHFDSREPHFHRLHR